jgi:hypothetical protein
MALAIAQRADGMPPLAGRHPVALQARACRRVLQRGSPVDAGIAVSRVRQASSCYGRRVRPASVRRRRRRVSPERRRDPKTRLHRRGRGDQRLQLFPYGDIDPGVGERRLQLLDVIGHGPILRSAYCPNGTGQISLDLVVDHCKPAKVAHGLQVFINRNFYGSRRVLDVSIQVGSLIFGVSGVMGGLRDVMILRCVRVGGAVA